MKETTTKTLTFDDFCVLVKDGQQADLIDGKIYMASPDNTDANKLSVWLVRLLGDFVELKDAGEIYHSRVAYRLDKSNAPEPDIGFVSKARLDKVKRGFVEGPPDLALEIVSPESIERDYEKKHAQYQRFGVREYWIVDEVVEKVMVLHLDAKNKYRDIRAKKGAFHSEVLEGFWLRSEWLWQRPLPRKMDILNEILAP